ncbi:hypothetical protein XA68_12358 [Ophiocordyceps unilateralis]|uniref:Uncharacterized protein n=1 Tax=Ophiocordyceps unilateralis TaxID=268505 RepID=A0A2A9PR50_OPHUN|nr:hypothetical protein XA68_12358 [Ophiocordyceps unilateralis]
MATNYRDASSTFEPMAPKLTEDEIDDVMYLARAGETEHLSETLSCLAEREKTSPEEILATVRDENGSTPLHMATGNGHLETTRNILSLKPSIDTANNNGNTPLHWASLGGHLSVVELLVARVDGANQSPILILQLRFARTTQGKSNKIKTSPP